MALPGPLPNAGKGHAVPTDWMQEALWPLVLRTSATAISTAEAFAVLLIAGARLGDIFGRRRMFLLGLAGFTAFSAACAISQDIGMLIAFRALQGASGP